MGRRKHGDFAATSGKGVEWNSRLSKFRVDQSTEVERRNQRNRGLKGNRPGVVRLSCQGSMGSALDIEVRFQVAVCLKQRVQDAEREGDRW